MATPDPTQGMFSVQPGSVSKETYTIAGILTNVYGLRELHPSAQAVSCLWLLHPRLQTQECMVPLADKILNDWNTREDSRSQGLVAATFDQRNHGSRMIDKLANEAWKSGNERHAQDMFSIYHGTSVDASLLITYFSSYLFPTSDRIIVSNIVLGVSLGGHAAWQCLFHDPRVLAAVIVIGCPDYFTLMSDRARMSKRETWSESTPPGAGFLGSKDFPTALVQAVQQYDPAGMLLGKPADRINTNYDRHQSSTEYGKVLQTTSKTLTGKWVLNLAGGADKLVPYACAEPFLNWLRAAVAPGGVFENNSVHIEDKVYEGVGHQMNDDMVEEAMSFIAMVLQHSITHSSEKTSKM